MHMSEPLSSRWSGGPMKGGVMALKNRDGTLNRGEVLKKISLAAVVSGAVVGSSALIANVSKAVQTDSA